MLSMTLCLIRATPVLALALLLGCGANTFSTAEPSSNVDLQARVIRDSGLSSSIEVRGARVYERGGARFGQVTLVNRGNSPRTVKYRFDWLDAEGVNVTPLRNDFAEISLAAGETREVTGSAAARATDFRFTIQSAGR